MFALLFLITEHRFGSHSSVGWHQVDLSYNLSKLHISAEVCLPITHQKELTAHLRQDDPPSKRIIHQRRFRSKFLCGNTCVWTLQLVMVCIYEKKKWMDTVWRWWGTSGCKRLQMWRWLQHGAATHTFKCFPWIDPGYCKRAFIICVATFSLDGWQSDPAAFWSLKAASPQIFLALWWHRFLKSEKDPQLRQQPLLFVIAHCLWSVRIFAYLAITLCRSVGFLSGSFN